MNPFPLQQNQFKNLRASSFHKSHLTLSPSDKEIRVSYFSKSFKEMFVPIPIPVKFMEYQYNVSTFQAVLIQF